MVGDTYTQVLSGLTPGQSVVLADYAEPVPSSNTDTFGGFGGWAAASVVEVSAGREGSGSSASAGPERVPGSGGLVSADRPSTSAFSGETRPNRAHWYGAAGVGATEGSHRDAVGQRRERDADRPG